LQVPSIFAGSLFRSQHENSTITAITALMMEAASTSETSVKFDQTQKTAIFKVKNLQVA
jgi:hypothetical protein